MFYNKIVPADVNFNINLLHAISIGWLSYMHLTTILPHNGMTVLLQP